jgi:hypothetical protein
MIITSSDECFALVERFRTEEDPEEAQRLGDELGRMIFGGIEK